MLTVLVILAVFLQIAIALGVYFRRKGGHTNKIFMFLTLSLAAWAFTNYIAITIPQNSNTIYAIRTVLTFVVIQNTLFYFFAKTFPDKRLSQLPKIRIAVVIYSLFVILLTQSPFLFTSIAIKNGTANPNPGPVIIFFMIHALFTIFGGLTSLFHLYRKSRGQERRQLGLVIIASVILWLIVPVTNFAITLSARTTAFVKFSPFYTLIFGIFITYAIVSQKLFDIRTAVARSVTYVLLLGTIATIYSVGIFGVINVIFEGSGRELIRQILSVTLVIPLILSFQSIKKFFDRITTKIFYRDSYDTQVVLDLLGNAIVAEIDLHKLINNTRRILNDALKNSFIEFALIKNNVPYFESQNKVELEANIKDLEEHLKEQHKDILITDDMPSQSLLKRWFATSEIAVSLRLKTQHQIVGYVLFGEKRSGDIYNTQDIRMLTIVANELAVAFQNALRFEEIEKFNVTLQQKVNEATRELRHANERLKALDEVKDEFISMASHQLRTPLTSVKGYVSMVLEGDGGKLSAMQKKLLDEAFFSSQRMVYLIADLLNVSRLRTGKFVIENKPSNLADVVEGEISQLAGLAKSSNLTLTFDKPKNFPTLMLDETKIRQVIMNFADNAVHYTPAGGHIKISLTESPDAVEFLVVDDGIGVPKSEQHHLFSKFYRAGNAKKARPDGTGLGLFMAKKVIVAQGGAVIFRSEEGQGSTFGFTFDKSKLKVPAKLSKQAAQKSTDL